MTATFSTRTSTGRDAARRAGAGSGGPRDRCRAPPHRRRGVPDDPGRVEEGGFVAADGAPAQPVHQQPSEAFRGAAFGPGRHGHGCLHRHQGGVPVGAGRPPQPVPHVAPDGDRRPGDLLAGEFMDPLDGDHQHRLEPVVGVLPCGRVPPGQPDQARHERLEQASPGEGVVAAKVEAGTENVVRRPGRRWPAHEGDQLVEPIEPGEPAIGSCPAPPRGGASRAGDQRFPLPFQIVPQSVHGATIRPDPGTEPGTTLGTGLGTCWSATFFVSSHPRSDRDRTRDRNVTGRPSGGTSRGPYRGRAPTGNTAWSSPGIDRAGRTRDPDLRLAATEPGTGLRYLPLLRAPLAAKRTEIGPRCRRQPPRVPMSSAGDNRPSRPQPPTAVSAKRTRRDLYMPEPRQKPLSRNRRWLRTAGAARRSGGQ